MLVLVFRSKVERLMFGNALHLLKPKVHFASDCHTLENLTVRFKCGTLNSLGLERETVVLLDCERGTISFGDEADSIVVKGKVVRASCTGRQNAASIKNT